MTRHLLALIALAAVACTASSADRPGTLSTEVTTDKGVVRGAISDGILSFKSIPFAQPPVGALRWRAPQPIVGWQGVRDATRYANDCMQIPFARDAAPLGTPPAEDCLYLNVWTRADTASNARLPVMVWIYGGGLVNGGSSPAVYDGSEFARQGVVLVSFNYRLGRFGFFAHPALTSARADGGQLGNYGYMDQIAALEWVKRNVGRFGGDPDNVTVFGESAGGGSVHMLMTSQVTRGLFAKAIVMSGGGRSGLTGPKTLQSAEQSGVEFARWAGVMADGPEVLSQLRALPADKVAEGVGLGALLMAASGQRSKAPETSGPMIDGRIVLESSEGVYRRGAVAKVPFMAGANSADIGLPGSGDAFTRFGPDTERARQVYASIGDDKTIVQAIAMDARMIEPARFAVQQMRRIGQPAWHYRAGYVPEVMRQEWKTGLPHACEIPFFFKTIDARFPGRTTAADQAMAAQMSAYFVNFARTGNPNGGGLPPWPPYDDATRPLMNFTNEGVRGGADPWRARLDLIEAAAERSLSDRSQP